MKVEVQELTAIKHALKVEIPPDVVSKEFSQAYAALRKRVKIPGFRPGKAPLSLLERRYGQEVQEEIVQKLIPDYYRKAIEQTGLDPVEFPSIAQISVKKDAPLSFTATVEVRPKVQVKDYAGIRVTRKAVSVGEEEVEKTLYQLRDQHGQLEVHEPDRKIEKGDYAIIDIEGFSSGKPLSDQKAAGVLVEVGSQTLLSEIEDALLGRQKGDAFETPLDLPKDHKNPDLAGKTLVYQVRVQEVKRKILPEADDDFAKDLGFESLQVLREKLKAEIEARLKAEQTAQEKEQILKHLIAGHRFETPPSMVEREARELAARLSARDGSSEAAPPGKEVVALAEERVRGRLLLRAVADQEGLSAEDQEVEEELAALARGMKVTAQELKQWVLSREGSLDGIRTTLLERKALEFLHGKANFVSP